MARQWQTPSGAYLNEGGSARQWQMPDGSYVNEEAAGGGTSKDLAAAGAAVASGTADLSTGAAAFKAAAFYYHLLGDCNV